MINQFKRRDIYATPNVNKKPPKGKVKFNITLSEEQKSENIYIVSSI